MKEIVVISGKGGTGKTSITASFACLEGSTAVVADCDVDAADMHLLLQPDFGKPEDFYSGQVAVIDRDKCTQCGGCVEVCRFDAIRVTDEGFEVKLLDCEGCGYCSRICPAGAINNQKLNAGTWFVSSVKTGGRMVHARLGIGADNSGKLVARVKNEARNIANLEHKELIIIDGPPGIGCPVISSLSGADFVVLVTEPTPFGLYDLTLAVDTMRSMNLAFAVVVNRAGVGDDRVNRYCENEKIPILLEIPEDERVAKAYSRGVMAVDAVPEMNEMFRELCRGIYKCCERGVSCGN